MKVQFKIDPVELSHAAHIEGVLMSKGIKFTASVVASQPKRVYKKRAKGKRRSYNKITENDRAKIRGQVYLDNNRPALEIVEAAGVQCSNDKAYKLVRDARLSLRVPSQSRNQTHSANGLHS
jgi:hypothetical protein